MDFETLKYIWLIGFLFFALLEGSFIIFIDGSYENVKEVIKEHGYAIFIPLYVGFFILWPLKIYAYHFILKGNQND